MFVGMFAKRIIPCLDVDRGRVVKGVNFVNLTDAGDPVECAKIYDAQGADELVFLDITASSDGRKTVVDMVERVAKEVFIPFTVGGGIRSVEDFREILNAGADKVAVNSAAIKRPELIREAAEKFGSQCVVCAIDAKRAAKVFNAMKPALQKAFNLLGYKDRDIDDLLYSVLETAREIPLYESNPPMVRLNDNMFTWQYAELEKLSPAQKCVMRMGQGNVKRIREQVERLAAESGLENLQDELQ